MAVVQKKSLGPPPDPIAVLRAHRASVTALAFHPCSSLLLSGDADGELKIWDLLCRRAISSSRVHNPTAGVMGIEILGDEVLSQGRDGTVKCWRLTESALSREPLSTINSNSYHFCKLSVPKVIRDISSGELLSSSGKDDTRNSEAVRSDHLQNLCIGKEMPSQSIATSLSLERQLIAIAGEQCSEVEIWDLNSGTRVQQICYVPGRGKGDTANISGSTSSAGMCMAVQAFQQPGNKDSLYIVAGHEDGSMVLWDSRYPSVPLFSTRFHSEPVLSISLDGTCKGGASGAADDKLVSFNINLLEGSCEMRKQLKNVQPGIADISIRPDDKIIATAGWDHRVRVYDYLRMRPLAILKYHSDTVNRVEFSDDSKFLASASKDTTIALWSIYPSKSYPATDIC